MTIAAVTAPALGDAAAEAHRLADEACAEAGIRLVEAHDAATSRRLSEVLDRIWGRTASPMMDPGLLVALAHAGNYEAVAEDEHGEPVGGAAGFCGPAGMPFHSHIVGLLPDRVGRGAGRAIKLVQRAWCLDRGIAAMTWTYDPLIARNAYFNLRRLGAAAVEYLPDFYGTMTDAINAGQHSDRVLISWDLRATPPAPDAAGPSLADAEAAVAELDGAPTPFTASLAPDRLVTVAVPADIEALRRTDPALAGRWRAETREALTSLLGEGRRIIDFARTDQGGAYVLSQRHLDRGETE